MALVAVGVALRLVRYFLQSPDWGDEAFSVNFLNRDYVGLLKPLDYKQVAPRAIRSASSSSANPMKP